jgi:hypothetical protein
VGAAPEAVDDPYKLIQFILHSFEKLQNASGRIKPKTRKTTAKR